ncbi:hypothetical protein Cfor_03157, partial [Coptotermes formosanus]
MPYVLYQAQRGCAGKSRWGMNERRQCKQAALKTKSTFLYEAFHHTVTSMTQFALTPPYAFCALEETQSSQMSHTTTRATTMNGPLEEENDLSKLPNRVADMLAGRAILITGGTGFMGKVLIEKILRTCSDVDTIYILVRAKKGKEPCQRVDELFASALFGKLKTQTDAATLSRKVVAIAGDVTMTNLGLSAANHQLLADRVSIVFHFAATIRFDAPLKQAVIINTRGTKYMLDFAKEMKNLEAFVHFSTAYCHLNERVLYEKLYPPPADPHKIIKCVEWLEDDVINSMTKKILGDFPNTYAYTKALSEGLVAEQMDKLPVLILRPSIVVPVWKEPLPGWTDNLNGPTGLLIGAGKGIIRTMYCNQEGYADYLPVDIAVNAALIFAWNYVSN